LIASGHGGLLIVSRFVFRRRHVGTAGESGCVHLSRVDGYGA
jgi:hypothetical protein